MAETNLRVGEHERVVTRYFSGALAPAQVTPYCSRCNVAWPCPPAAAELTEEQPEP